MIYKNKKGWVYEINANGKIIACLKKGKALKHKDGRHRTCKSAPQLEGQAKYVNRINGIMPQAY